MSFGNFLRRLSTDFDKTPSGTEATQATESTGAINSIFTTPGKLFDTVNVKTSHLVSDLNQKLDLGGKLDTLKQASITKLEHVVQGIQKEPTRDESERTPTEPQNVHANPFNETERSETDKPLRRQSTHAGSRPPRPPPPKASALNRAMSLDETNLLGNRPGDRKMSKKSGLSPTLEPPREAEEERFGSGKFTDDKCFSEQKRSNFSKSVDDDGDSSASEYGAFGDQPIYKAEAEEPNEGANIEPKKELHSAVPHSSDTLDELSTDHLQELMKMCVPALLHGRYDEVQNRDQELQAILGTSQGRMEFVNCLEQEARGPRNVLELRNLQPLLDKIAYLLGECQDAEDFAPARKLLTTSLLFYVNDSSASVERAFLFVHIKTQPIWQSLRFWNACFFQSVQEARAKLTEQNQPERRLEEVVYEQLTSYLNTMNVFDLHTTVKQEFLRKHSSLFNLPDDEVSKLQAIIGDIS